MATMVLLRSFLEPFMRSTLHLGLSANTGINGSQIDTNAQPGCGGASLLTSEL